MALDWVGSSFALHLLADVLFWGPMTCLEGLPMFGLLDRVPWCRCDETGESTGRFCCWQTPLLLSLSLRPSDTLPCQGMSMSPFLSFVVDGLGTSETDV